MAPKSKPVRERFFAKVQITPGCWEWTASLDRDGYGEIRVSENHKERSNRFSWILHYGDPKELHVLHKCDNRKCVNPAHLFLGTNQDNTKDRDLKNRQAKGKRSGRYTKPERTARGIRHGSKTQPGSMIKDAKGRFAGVQ